MDQSIASAGAVNDGAWHRAVLSAVPSGQALYLDGALVGKNNHPGSIGVLRSGQLGTGYVTGWPATQGTVAHFRGALRDVLAFHHPLSEQQLAGLLAGQGVK